jgi:hypothetical protein
VTREGNNDDDIKHHVPLTSAVRPDHLRASARAATNVYSSAATDSARSQCTYRELLDRYQCDAKYFERQTNFSEN